MKWKKLGKIFGDSPEYLFSYTQSPQVIVFDDFIRVYFSTRNKDESGKYLSNVACVDFNKSFSQMLRHYPPGSVIKLGDLGCFDEHGIFPMNVVRHPNRSNVIFAYTTGWSRRVSVSADTSIGLAISTNNGVTFDKFGTGPILSSSLHEPFLIGDAFVRVFAGVFHMWYVYGVRWIIDPNDGSPQRVYKIGHATSEDGICWERKERNIIPDKLNENECQALPTVIKFNDRIFHMFFCYRQAFDFRTNKTNSYRIGHAYSIDLKKWIRDDASVGIDISEEGWDSEMICYPHVFECDGKIYMLYNGNEFGRYGFGLAVMEQ